MEYAELRFQVMNKASSFERLTYLDYQHIPVTYVLTARDKAVKPKYQHKRVDDIIAQGKAKVKKVVLDADHCAMVNHPNEIVDILLASVE